MAGPYTGTWRATAVSEADYTGALKQGTGINPVHRIRGDLTNPGRKNTPALIYPELNLGPGQETSNVIGDTDWPELYADSNELYGYNSQTGLADRPRYGVPNERVSVTEDWPPWGGSRKTQAGGNFVRSLLKGALLQMRIKQIPSETVTEGWRNKAHGIAADSVSSDDKQLIVNTSGVQRYETRTGSQSTGRASEYSAPIHSRVVGQKLKKWSGGQRHYDMRPYDQDEILRPFLSRQAGTSYVEWNEVNSMYQSNPIQRQPAEDPYPGSVSPPEENGYGYVAEDVLY